MIDFDTLSEEMASEGLANGGSLPSRANGLVVSRPAAPSSQTTAANVSNILASKAAIDHQRLAKFTEEWRHLLKEACIVASANFAAATPPREQQKQQSPQASSSVESGSTGGRALQTHSPIGGYQPGAQAAPVADSGPSSVVNSLLESLDRFFADQKNCEQASDEAGAHNGQVQGDDDGKNGEPPPIKFRVQVPKQYPGVQYRRSKNLEDRYLRYAKLGTLVQGHVEDNGEWLRISDKVYLPMKVGNQQILEKVDNQNSGATGSARKSLWWACSHGNQGEEEEVVNDLDEDTLNKAN